MNTVQQVLRQFRPVPAHRRIGPIGLQLENAQMRAVQLGAGSTGGLALLACQTVPYGRPLDVLMEEPLALKQLVREMLRNGRFKGREVVTAMPPSKVKISSLAYQQSARETEAETILKLMADRVDGDLANYVIDFIPVRTDSENNRFLALVTTCRRDDVIAYLELLRKAGLKVEALEIGPVALRRLVAAMSKLDRDDNVLVINFGNEKSYLSIMSRRRLLLDQEIDFGAQQLVQSVAQDLDLSPDLAHDLIHRQGLNPGTVAELPFSDLAVSGVFNPVLEIVRPHFLRLADEIRRAYLYAASQTRGDQIQRIYIFGSVARWPGTCELMNQMTDVPVTSLPGPLAVFAAEPWLATSGEESPGPEYAVASGLALRGMSEND